MKEKVESGYQNLEVFSSQENFLAAFSEGLKRLLNEKESRQGFNFFNIALANACQNQQIFQNLRPELAKVSQELIWVVDGNRQDPEVEMFLRIYEMIERGGLNARIKKTNGWLVREEPLRQFKKPHAAAKEIKSIYPPSTENFFGRPGMREQLIWRGDLGGREICLFFNKFPFYYGGLLTDDIKTPHLQLLEPADVEWYWQAGRILSETMGEVYFGYNGYGASCSIPTWHFHLLFQREEPYPVEQEKWQHNGGSEPYPVGCYCTRNAEESKACLKWLRENNIPHNLIHKAGKNKGKDFWFPRQFQDPLRRQAFSELGGEIITSHFEPWHEQAEEIEAFLANVSLTSPFLIY